jgi:hypothetical protein
MFRAQVLACVRVCAADLGLACVALPSLLLCLICDHNSVRARGSNLWRFLAKGKISQKEKIVVFKSIIGSLERG